jgi:hypothetical protein
MVSGKIKMYWNITKMSAGNLKSKYTDILFQGAQIPGG